MGSHVRSRMRTVFCVADRPALGGAILAIAATITSTAGGQTLAWYRFEEGAGTDVVDSTSGAVHGQLAGPATFSADAPRVKGADNRYSADFTAGGHAIMTGLAFIFHDPAVGGAPGDATLEWFLKVPAPVGHNPVFWTNADDDGDGNRFNIFWNAEFTGAPDSDRFVEGDFRGPDGSLSNIGAPDYDSGNPLSLGEWHHIAIVRRDQGDGSYEWTWYVDGVPSANQTNTSYGPLPTAATWRIAERPWWGEFPALIDEVRFSDGALSPDEFLYVPPSPCPQPGDPDYADTHCRGLTVDPPGGRPGTFTAKASAADDTGDAASYTFVADDGIDAPTVIGPQASDAATFDLAAGTWTISVTVDDTARCDDAAPDNRCEVTGIVVAVPPFAPAHYRFEEGSGTDVVDSLSGAVHGHLAGPAGFSADAPHVRGMDNEHSVDFTAGGHALMDGAAFVFHAPEAGGAPGDATLEWFLKVPAPVGQNAIFWTNADDDGDGNRFNIIWNVDFTGIPGSDLFVDGDYRDPSGDLFNIGGPNYDSENPLTLNAWHHLAIVRRDQGGGTYGWTWYVDGVLSANQTATTSGPLPTARTWRIADRPNWGELPALIDEVRVTDRALAPDEFLYEARCPAPGDPDYADAHCQGLAIENPGEVPGRYVLTATGNDATGDPLRYTFSASDGVNPPVVKGPQSEATAIFRLAPGRWTVSVTVGDDPRCADAAADATCSTTLEVPVLPARPVNPVAYYRFEEGSGADVVDSVSGAVDGTLGGGATFSSDTPAAEVPGTGEENRFSADFTAGGRAIMTGTSFIFHAPEVGGAEGGATLEWYFKVPAPYDHSAFFWTNADDDGDSNRFNIFWNAAFAGVPDGDRCIEGDYRDPTGNLVNIGGPNYRSGDPVSVGEWHHVAIVRYSLGNGDFLWDWYIDGALSASHENTTRGQFPTAHTWRIAGRPGWIDLHALIDEVRMTDIALRPNEFLIASAEVPSIPAGSLDATGGIREVSLAWDAPEIGADTYTVYRDHVKIAETALTKYVDRGLADDARYCYQVAPRKGGSDGPLTPEVCARTAARPGAPSDLAATAGTDAVTLAWSPPAGGADSYVVYRDDAPIAEVTTPAYVDAGLAARARHCYAVAAKKGGVEGDPSASRCAAATGPVFKRGDADGNGAIELTDAIFILSYMFLGGEKPSCWNAADADRNGAIEITDAISILSYMFLGGDRPEDPGPEHCGPQPAEGQSAGDACSYPPDSCK